MLGEKLKIIRTANGLSQKEVAVSLKLSEVRYCQYENNRRSPDYETLRDIAKFYKVSIDYLLDNDLGNQRTMDKVYEHEVLRNILIKIGFIRKDEFLNANEYERLKEFIVQNKKFIKENK